MDAQQIGHKKRASISTRPFRSLNSLLSLIKHR